VSVTGPSVLTPLLGSLGCNERVRTTMLGEGVIIDPLAALVTLALLHAAVAPHEGGADLLGWVLARVGVGLAVGIAMAALARLLLRRVPEVTGREVAVAVVACALAAYAIAEEIAPEAGLTTAVVLGIALGNLPYPHHAALHEFQDAVVVFLLASVYVLLAASIDLDHVTAVLPGGLVVILVLVLVARPAVVAAATAGSALTRGERVLMAAVAPRGVVAASLAAFVAAHAGPRLGAHGDSFVALVFLMILMTTGVQSWYARALGRRLGVVSGGGERGAAAATAP
jgi:NhaP-type Na+/H+ or K+/H+ antiporter